MQELGSNVFIQSYQVKSQTMEIVLVLSGNTESDLFEYMIEIYETYGMVLGTEDETRWIISQPTYKFNNPLQVEVTIRYA